MKILIPQRVPIQHFLHFQVAEGQAGDKVF